MYPISTPRVVSTIILIKYHVHGLYSFVSLNSVAIPKLNPCATEAEKAYFDTSSKNIFHVRRGCSRKRLKHKARKQIPARHA